MDFAAPFGSLTKSAIANTARNAGTSAIMNSILNAGSFSPYNVKTPNATTGPTSAPSVSIARWRPNAFPRFFSVVDEAIIASRGEVRRLLPILSEPRMISMCCHALAKTSPILSRDESPYPAITKSFLLPERSDQ